MRRSTAPEDVHGFVVPVQFVNEGPAGGTRVDHVKLFRNLPGLQFEGRIHEQILGSLREHGGKIARCDAYVLHSGYDTSEDGQKKKRVRDSKLLMLDLRDRPDHPFVLFNLGMTAHYTEEHEDAVRWFEKCLAVSKPEESHVRKTYSLLAVSHRELGDPEKALETLREGLSQVGEDPELRFHLGLLNSSLGNYEEAVEHYEKTLAIDTSMYFSSMDIGILGFKTKHNLAGVKIALGKYDEAKPLFEEALAEAPEFLPSAFELFDQALTRSDYGTAHRMMEHVRAVEGVGKSWAEMALKYAQKIDGPSSVENTLRPEAARNPEVGAVYARWLAGENRSQEAKVIWDKLVNLGDAEAAFYLGIHESRVGNFDKALEWMHKSHELNPGHEQTAGQIASLEKMLAGAGDGV